MSALANCPLFNHLSASELQNLESAARLKAFPANEVVFQEGDPGDGVYVILSGKVQVSCLVAPKDRRVLSELGPGEFFGEIAVLDAQARSASVTASEPAELAFLPSEAVIKALEQAPGFGVNMAREMVQRLREFNQTYTREVIQAERLALVGRFARSIVHDFKNPLNIIGISADMTTMPNATAETREAARGRIRRQVDRLSNMITELLEFTRGSAAEVVLTRVNFAGFLQPLIEELSMEVEPRQVKLQCEAPPPEAPVAMDPRRLTHVFHNLVNNACDAMPDGGIITLRFQEHEQELVTEIQDSGPGIAPAIASRIFEAFATHGKASGTGLGLSICKRIVQDHGGRIEAGNADSGGAVFRVALPLARSVAQE